MAAAAAASGAGAVVEDEGRFLREQEAKAARRKQATDAAEAFKSHESIAGSVFKVSGPLVVAAHMRGAFMHELVRVGSLGIVGEIIKIDKDQAYVQCYEDTSGLRVGDPVERTQEPLSVTLGPGLMAAILDGIQRPLQLLAGTDAAKPSPYIPLGKIVKPLDESVKWKFMPSGSRRPGAADDDLLAGQPTADAEPVCIAVGSLVYGGIIVGEVRENDLMQRHMIMVPPDVYGRVKSVAVGEAKDITITDTIMTVTQVDGTDVDIKLAHKWPVRKPRPVALKLPGEEALVTGQRVIDVLFPSVLGGTCAIPGAFGCGKTCISQALSKHSNTDAIVYVGCGERGNEMAEVLSDFPELTVDVKIGGTVKTVDIMQRTCLVANTSNMPVAAREASIYTGITIAEYFRDMGKHVALMADSTSRWAEALREISGRLGEMPADGGYPAYLSARLARFYERAGLAKTVGSPERRGSVTVVGAVSPPGGDFSDPVTSATLGIVQVFWGLDKQLAQRKHFPSVNWTKSFSKYRRVLDPWFDARSSSGGYKYTQLRDAASHILQTEDGLLKIVQLVGEDSLEPSQKLTLEVAKLIREDFLQQDAFSEHDYTCSLEKSLGILRCIVHLHDACLDRINATAPDAAAGGAAAPGTQFSWSQLMAAKPELVYKVSRLKFEVMPEPTANMDTVRATFNSLVADIDDFFHSLA